MIYKMIDQRPPDEEEVWWWDAREDAWRVGISLIMDTEHPDFERWYPYWAPYEDIPEPGAEEVNE